MSAYFFVKTVHILCSTVLFGTGLGIAFFMLQSYFSHDIRQKYFATRITVLADYVFTFPAVILQPLSGAWLVSKGGYHWSDLWLTLTVAIYVTAGVCWLPVVWIQIKLKNMVISSMRSGEALPQRYHRLFKVWFILGWPAFLGLVIVFFLMVIKPI